MHSDPLCPATDDPGRLLALWQALLARQAHTHLPQAAAALGVSEARLLATRVGTGAVCLKPDLLALLDGIEQWRKIFIVTPNSLGVTIAILDVLEHSASRDEPIRLLGAQHQITLDAARVRHCYLFEDRDAHGYSLSLCWFDADGTGLGKLFLRSRRGREFALPRLMAQAQAKQSRVFNGADRLASGTERVLPDMDSGQQAYDALTAASRLEAVELRMVGGMVDSRYDGPLSSLSRTPGALHFSAAGCKAHLRPAAAQSIFILQDNDGRRGLQINTATGSLSIMPSVAASHRCLPTMMREHT